MKKIIQKIWKFFCNIFAKNKIVVSNIPSNIQTLRRELLEKYNDLDKVKATINAVNFELIPSSELKNAEYLKVSLEKEIQAINKTLNPLLKEHIGKQARYHVVYEIDSLPVNSVIEKDVLLTSAVEIDTKNRIPDITDPQIAKFFDELHEKLYFSHGPGYVRLVCSIKPS